MTVVDSVLDSDRRYAGHVRRAYHAFGNYRDLGVLRSLDKAWRQHRRDCAVRVSTLL